MRLFSFIITVLISSGIFSSNEQYCVALFLLSSFYVFPALRNVCANKLSSFLLNFANFLSVLIWLRFPNHCTKKHLTTLVCLYAMNHIYENYFSI